MMRKFLLATCVALLAWPASARTLTMAVAVETTSLDPHFHNIQFNHSTDDHIFDALTYQAPDGAVVPWLAESYRMVDATTWEFVLRDGVHFHDGTPLDSDDIAFTFDRVPTVQGPSSYKHFIDAVSGFERVDARRFRLKTKEAAPFLPFDLSGVAILSRKLHTGATTADFNSGKAAVGTGPYKFVQFTRGERLALARNPDWWGARQPWDEVILRPIASDASRLSALLAGEVDLADRMAPDDLERIRNDPKLALASGRAHQVLYLFPDSTHDTLPLTWDKQGKPLGKNPTRDPKVREALSLAINREAIARAIMNGAGYPAEQMVAPGAIGRDETLPPLAYDPVRAKKLLAEAGYPDGWKWTMVAPSNMYQNDAKVAQAIAQMFTRIGIETSLDTFTPVVFYPKINAREHPLFMTGYLSSSSVTVLGTVVVSPGVGGAFGQTNRMGYSNPALDKLFLGAIVETDPVKRATEMARAMRMTIEDRAVIPVIFTGYNWATRKDRVTYTPNVLGYTQAINAQPVP